MAATHPTCHGRRPPLLDSAWISRRRDPPGRSYARCSLKNPCSDQDQAGQAAAPTLLNAARLEGRHEGRRHRRRGRDVGGERHLHQRLLGVVAMDPARTANLRPAARSRPRGIRNHRQHDAAGSDRRPGRRLDRERQAIRLFPGRPVQCSARRRSTAGRPSSMRLPDHGDAIKALVAAITVGRAVAIPYRHRRDGIVAGTLGETERRTSGRQAGARLPASRRVRAVKTAEEIARLRRVAWITEASIDAALAVAREGATEGEMARAFHGCTVSHDAFPVIGCIGFGTRAAMPNVQPSAARAEIRRSDPFRRRRPVQALSCRHRAHGRPRRSRRQDQHLRAARCMSACSRRSR